MRHRNLACLLASGLLGAYQAPAATARQAAPEPVRTPADSPALSAEESLSRMQVQDGFKVELVAAEPLVSAPVALSFDARGRIWVVEMTAFMPDYSGSGEDAPNGKIVILEDGNGDGRIDRRTVFLDGLVLPRALALVGDGILVAEPPNLWYYGIEDDKPTNKVLIDAAYTAAGNPEHQPNGLYRALDNWIYSAKSSKRYRRRGDAWLTETTHFRGQWGLSQDDQGRLYYNNNSDNLLGDYFAPGLGAGNRNQDGVAGYSETIVADTRVFPAHDTPGVNRGYVPGILDARQRLSNFTAACGPLIYRGGRFGPAYAFNAFVAEPAGNLVKRDVLEAQGNLVSGALAYQEHEFLASTDERFRPVNLYDGPDGALYIVDMYRGIIQHKTYLTSYLKEQIDQRQLASPLSLGRIYKVVPAQHGAARWQTPLPGNAIRLATLLGDENGWVRDKAQQLLVDGQLTAAVPALRAALRQRNNVRMAIHALWTLEGLAALRPADVLVALRHPDVAVRTQALSVLPQTLDAAAFRRYRPALEGLIVNRDSLAAPYLAQTVATVRRFDAAAAKRLLQELVSAFPDDRYVADAIVSGVPDREVELLSQLESWQPSGITALRTRLQQAVANKEETRLVAHSPALARVYPRGAAIFNSVCQTCHGDDGNGIKGLGPPLNRSEWVNDDANRLITVVLYGLTGPVTVRERLYQPPEVSGEMPGIAANAEFTDDDIAQVLSFVRQSWGNAAGRIDTADVARVRAKWKDRQNAFTVQELIDQP
ncbi:MAG: c-type cytochrome [Pseudomonadota bacterium]